MHAALAERIPAAVDARGAVKSWSEFREHCVANVQRILDTNDGGMYAKLYADDVTRLLMVVAALNRQRDIDTTEAEHIWNRDP